MHKKILITGATDGIGLETAKSLIKEGHEVILHGRNPDKLKAIQADLGGAVDGYIADLSDLMDVKKMAKSIMANHSHLDVLVNNAGIFKTLSPITKDDLDIRFVVNTIAPYLLLQELMPCFDGNSRIVNLSSAAQAPVSLDALAGKKRLADMEAYAQSKLAITMWTAYLAQQGFDPLIVAVNPGSLLASKMVKEGFGVAGNDIGIGVDIVKRASLSEEFSTATGRYYDNDARQFAPPHPSGQDMDLAGEIIDVMEDLITKYS